MCVLTLRGSHARVFSATTMRILGSGVWRISPPVGQRGWCAHGTGPTLVSLHLLQRVQERQFSAFKVFLAAVATLLAGRARSLHELLCLVMSFISSSSRSSWVAHETV